MLGRLFCLLSALFLLASEHNLKADENTVITSWDGSVFRINDTKTRVSIASVLLFVSDLKPENGSLVGEYSIVVPLMKSKNDTGKIVLPLSLSMNAIGAEGGVLRGKAISYQEGKTPNPIICEIIPEQNQKILLNIKTSDRTLKFASRYSIVETPVDS